MIACVLAKSSLSKRKKFVIGNILKKTELLPVYEEEEEEEEEGEEDEGEEEEATAEE